MPYDENVAFGLVHYQVLDGRKGLNQYCTSISPRVAFANRRAVGDAFRAVEARGRLTPSGGIERIVEA
jgi:hypothetical protein